ncbi:cupin domain-containing protein [Roseovarius sp. EL26]|uniref:cupin domain-containing protein n=1 Tax=Roseovarius sp. EL26 TaxID=2126672 RepID=UPI000EA30C33|nr:cupin domain-containing protein [Roseovarius sp. EL26]
MTAQDIITTLDLHPHPEGGHYRETWVADNEGRPVGTCIYFLLQGHEQNRWHKVDAAEIWHFYSGAPLVLSLAKDESGPAVDHTLGTDLVTGHRPQVIVPPNHWQMARCTGDYTLVGCTVSPGFQFEKFILAAPDFDIPR